jgi:DNA polymerase-3 subunit delta
MKIKPGDADRYLTNPSTDVHAILIYGPDDGAVRERVQTLVKARVGSPPDPMLVTELSEADLKADPARLADEAAAMSLIPGERVVRMKGSGETAAKLFKMFLSGCTDGSIKPSALVVVDAGDLKPSSGLRKAAESAKNAAAIACYADDARSVEALIRSEVKAQNCTIEPDALDLLTSRLGADRGITRQEISKLLLFKGSEDGAITRDDVEACLPPDADSDANMLADIVGCGEVADFDRAFSRARAGGQPPASLIRGVANHFQSLHMMSAAMESGTAPGQLVKSARPPLHFKRQPKVELQLRLWPRKDVETAISALADAECQTRTTGAPDDLLCHRTLLSLTRRAARKRR